MDWVPCIYYPIEFKKNKIQALIDSNFKINAKTLEYALKLGLKVGITNIIVQKINSFTLKTFEIILTSF